ncbi:hypothetical protein QBC35DRAFT_271762 [Podospora australis]|uniref:Mid2 domain-containing protein n=1 Tax=Podospora australis TaxID=1536484 RepID=A0AAN6WQC7_9PEZI|nr:hypothetical protein QBC35DRAFT_271762 [Podospora australis]
MLISRALGTLIVGLTAPVISRWTSTPDFAVHSHSKASLVERIRTKYIYNRQPNNSHEESTPETNLTDEQNTERTATHRGRKRQGSDAGTDDSTSALPVCEGNDGTTLACPKGTSCCVSPTGGAASGHGGTCDGSCSPPSSTLPTVVITETGTSTITSFTGVPETRVLIVTSTAVLTFINPTQQTQTSTITFISCFRRARRTFGTSLAVRPLQTPATASTTETPQSAITRPPAPKSDFKLQQQLRNRGAAAEKRDEVTLTSRVTITTTVFPNIVSRTRTHILFSTTVVAPNAVTTVFVSTTVCRPSASSTISIPVVTPTSSLSAPQPTTSSTTSSESVIPTSAVISTGSDFSTTSTVLIPSSPSSVASTRSSSSTTASPSTIDSTSATAAIPTPSFSATSVTETETETDTESQPVETMTTTSSSSAPTTTPMLNPDAPSDPSSLSPGQIAGLVLGIIFGLFFLILAAFFTRRLVIRRRSAQAQVRQKLTPPKVSGAAGPAPAPVVPPGPGPAPNQPNSGGSGDSSSGAYSGLTGEGEVRIVIRPAPKRRTVSVSSQVWPMPPGYAGRSQSYPIFLEETTTRGTSPQRDRDGDPGSWSIASEQGSLGQAPAEGRNISTGGGTQTRDGLSSVLSIGWDTSIGGSRSEAGGSFPGLGTLLTPPPVRRVEETNPLAVLGGRSSDSDDNDPMMPRPLLTRDDATGGSSGSNGNSSGVHGGGNVSAKGSFGIGKAW